MSIKKSIDPDLVSRYNYDEFIPAKFEPWMNFDLSPVLGEPAPDYPLWDLDQKEISLRQILSQNLYTVVEFGSFT
ncbi:MAG: hypothetical protein JW862_06920 [Anaerolineales bacterium]|nr:hypothetical protein [Anaerolineales bacterium]